MRKILLSFFLLLTFVLPLKADLWTGAAKKAQNAVVYLENSEGSCTGFVINTEKKYVMSAGHCFDKEAIWVDHVLGRVVSLDTKQDLMVLEVKDLDPEKTELKLSAKNPEIGQAVMSVGYGYGLERPQFRTTTVSDVAMVVDQGIGGPFIAVSAAYTPGQSGGPVINSDGDVVSIVQRGDNGTLGLGVGAETLRERVGRFWSKK